MLNKVKTKIHFNRVHMQRNDKRVWSAHTSKSYNMSEKILVMRDGEILLETFFTPNKSQPRAYLETKGKVTKYGNMTVVEI